MKSLHLAWIISLVLCNRLYAQNDIVKVISLDEFVVSASEDGFDTEDFVNRVRRDTTFYKAFLNLKYFPHDVEGKVIVYLKDDSERGTMERDAVQHLNDQEYMHVEILKEVSNGRIKKRNGEWRYFTAEMYDEVFFPSEPEKVSNRVERFEQELSGGSRIDKHKGQLKRMMFNPGSEIDNVPFIGDKLAIFDDHMVPYYDYSIFSTTYKGDSCIAFSCFTKEGMKEETVIQDLTSYFDPITMEVLGRAYRLAHSTILFTFDISIEVVNMKQGGWLLPQKVHYDGYWNVPFRKPEIIKFELNCSNYKTEVGRYAKP